MLKIPISMKEIFCRQNLATISLQVPSASLLDDSVGNCHRDVVDESGIIREADV
jgi:hypothetical protein